MEKHASLHVLHDFYVAINGLDWATLEEMHSHLTARGFFAGRSWDLLEQYRLIVGFIHQGDACNEPAFGCRVRVSAEGLDELVYKWEYYLTAADYEAIAQYHQGVAARMRELALHRCLGEWRQQFGHLSPGFLNGCPLLPITADARAVALMGRRPFMGDVDGTGSWNADDVRARFRCTPLEWFLASVELQHQGHLAHALYAAPVASPQWQDMALEDFASGGITRRWCPYKVWLQQQQARKENV